MDWNELEENVRNCRRCGLCEGRSNVVFGEGCRDARILLVGEGPGAQEDQQGRPFVGRSGKLLDEMLELVGLSREKNVYIANIVKCRPPQNRDPSPQERAACLPWLREQIALLGPEVVVCLGRIAAATLIDPAFRVTEEHGTWNTLDGILYTATFHPAALLRDPRRRPEAFGDLKEIGRVLHEKV